MFNTKKTSLYAEKSKASVQPDVLAKDANIFEQEMYAQQHTTYSENGAMKLITTGNPLVDDFGRLGMYRAPRGVNRTFETMERLYAVDPLLAVKEMAYLRLITRDIKYQTETFKAQRGQGLRSEFLSRLMWLVIHHKATFQKNLLLFISIGSWQDFFDLLELDLSYIHNGRNHVLDWNWMLAFLANYLQDSEQCNLIKKYLPQIKNAKRCTTLHSQCTNYIAKKIANYLFEGEKDRIYAQYRHLKASGTAHQWQQAISRKDFANINFNAIAGRALQKLTNSKFLENQGLEKKFEKWMEAQPIAKFTGYPYELFKNIATGYCSTWNCKTINLKNYQKMAINKQFMSLIETAKQNMNRDSKFICAIDTSGSMTEDATGTGISAAVVAKSMAVYFSYLLEGKFANTFLEFEDRCAIHSFKGSTPLEKFQTHCGSNWGSTNFLSVADLFCNLKNKGYKEEDFPTGVICVSDGEFGPSNRYYYGESNPEASNFNMFLQKLRNAGFSEEFVSNFKLVLWDVPRGQSPKFEALANRENFFYMSGFDPAGIAFLTGKEMHDKTLAAPKTAEELFYVAMDQEILNRIEL